MNLRLQEIKNSTIILTLNDTIQEFIKKYKFSLKAPDNNIKLKDLTITKEYISNGCNYCRSIIDLMEHSYSTELCLNKQCKSCILFINNTKEFTILYNTINKFTK